MTSTKSGMFYLRSSSACLFWGSDVTGQPYSYRQSITMFTEEMPWLTMEDKEWIMGRGLCECLGWELP